MIEMEASPQAAVGLAEAKAYLRVEHGAEDGLIAALVRSAGDMCEAFTGQILTERVVRETVAAGGSWQRLAARPVRAVESVVAVDAAGLETALGSALHQIDIDAAGDGWVRVPGAAGRVRVTYRAGLGSDWNAVPEPLRQGIVRLAAYLYAGRADGDAPPAAVTALWRPWRRLRMG